MRAPDGWLTLDVWLASEHEDAACDRLNVLGSTGVEVRPGDRADRLHLRAWFSAPPPTPDWTAGVMAALTPWLSGDAPPPVWAETPDQDWVSASRGQSAPVAAGRHFLFHPSWDRPPDPGGRICLEIDPGLGFGTGSHPSTRLCVALMERLFRCRHRRCLDAGCGSGILMLALDRWAVRRCPARPGRGVLVGVEIDPDAAEAARANLVRLGTSRPAEVVVADLADFQAEPFDFIFANTLSSILLRHLDRLRGLLAPGGLIVLAGLLAGEADDFRAHLSPLPWREAGRRVEDGWAALAMEAGR